MVDKNPHYPRMDLVVAEPVGGSHAKSCPLCYRIHRQIRQVHQIPPPNRPKLEIQMDLVSPLCLQSSLVTLAAIFALGKDY